MFDDELTPLQEEIIEEAMDRMINDYHHDHLCIDEIWSDDEIMEDREGAILALIEDTCEQHDIEPPDAIQ